MVSNGLFQRIVIVSIMDFCGATYLP